jgi:hypothetical protein
VAITVQDVVNEAPELTAFAATPSGASFIEGKITVAQGFMNRDLWGDNADYAWALLTAHLVLASRPELKGIAAGGGVLTGQTVGSASETYASGSSSSSATGPHSFTRPGMLYDSLAAFTAMSVL